MDITRNTPLDEVKHLRTRAAAILTTCRSILEFFAAQRSSRDQVKARIDWVRGVLNIIEEYTQKPEEQLRHDYPILEQTAKYLGIFANGWEHTLRRQEDGRKYEEATEWIKGFEVTVLGLPPELRRMIHKATEMNPSLVVESNRRLQEFLALPSSDKLKQAKVLLLENPDELASNIIRRCDVNDDFIFQPLASCDKNLIFASRTVPLGMTPGTADFQSLVSDMSELATAFNYVDPAADIRLLKVEYFFYHEHSNQFLFAQTPPLLTASMTTLRDAIRGYSFPNATPSVTARLRLAYKLAEAVFFFHTAGFLHQNITSSSIVAQCRSAPLSGGSVTDIENSYLMVSSPLYEAPAGTFDTAPEQKWDCEIFRHPDLLEGHRDTSYVRSYDIYSLGVVLLEVGRWQLVEKPITIDTTSSDLSECAKELRPRLGSRYRNLVGWCLGLKSDHIVGNNEFMLEVLFPLGDMAKRM